MKLAYTTPLMATGSAIQTWADGDATFDLFQRLPADNSLSPVEMAWMRPAIATAEGVLVWGFHYRPIWRMHPTAEFPVLILTDATNGERSPASLSVLQCALAAENRPGAYRLSELERVRSLVEDIGIVGSMWEELSPLLSVEADPWPLIERFRALPPVPAEAVDEGLIDLRTAEAIPREYAASAGRCIPVIRTLSFSNRRHALRMVVELLRGGADVEQLVQEMLHMAREEVIPFLRRRRYPILTDLECRFETIRRSALSGTGVTLTAPNNFEGDRFQVSFSFRNGTELHSRLNAAGRLEGRMDELLALLF
ncbi:MAG: hypothetical protein WD492_04940 [Alkalispirochaeta sp.]